MELESKPDFDEAVERFDAWWDCQIIDRPPAAFAPVSNGRPRKVPPKTYARLRDRWTDTEHLLDVFEAHVAGHDYLAESIPRFNPNLGPDLAPTLFGCELEFGDSTSWSTPAARSCAEILTRKPDFDNPYWTQIRQMTDRSIQRGSGRWITGLTDLHTNGDLLAALRDPQELCYDMADDIESVRAACEHVTDFFPQIYEDLYGPIAAAGQPSSTWVALPLYGRMYATSCDFICMISPEMFQRAILPDLVREMRHLDRNIFHLDGPGALVHLDTLLALEELDGVQWVYGAGRGPATEWIGVYQRIQAAGKCMQVICETMDEAVEMMDHLRPAGVWFTISKRYGREETAAFLARLERWAAGRRA